MSNVEWIETNGKWVEKFVTVENEDCLPSDPKGNFLVKPPAHVSDRTVSNIIKQDESNSRTEVIDEINDDGMSEGSEISVISSSPNSLPSNDSWYESMERRFRTSADPSVGNIEPPSENDNKTISERLLEIERNELQFYTLINSLKSNLENSRNENDQLRKRVVDLEKDLARIDQYGRRQNVEIAGIPNTVSDKALEKEVIKILHHIGMYWIDSYSIVACHRIGGKDRSGSKNVIVRFLHRKDSEATIKRKREFSRCKDIGYEHLFISENLCPAFRSVLKDLTNLKREGHIEAVWVTNGTIKYKIEDKASVKPEKIYHKSDISLLKSYIGLSP